MVLLAVRTLYVFICLTPGDSIAFHTWTLCHTVLSKQNTTRKEKKHMVSRDPKIQRRKNTYYHKRAKFP